VQEKILAAHRSGIKKIIVPAANENDISFNVPDSVKDGIKIVYVSDVRQVIKEVFDGHEIVQKLDGLGMIPLETVKDANITDT